MNKEVDLVSQRERERQRQRQRPPLSPSLINYRVSEDVKQLKQSIYLAVTRHT